MRITKVSYRKLISGPGFSHQAIEAEAEVERENGETPLEALERLQAWVKLHLDVDKKLDAERKQKLNRAIALLEQAVEEEMPF